MFAKFEVGILCVLIFFNSFLIISIISKVHYGNKNITPVFLLYIASFFITYCLYEIM